MKYHAKLCEMHTTVCNIQAVVHKVHGVGKLAAGSFLIIFGED